MTADADLLLVGGGLANGLIAWRLKQLRPELRVLLLEREERLGGNHTWSFHSGDLLGEQHEWVRPLVGGSWPTHEVRFPDYRRRLASGYHSVTSERFHEVVARDLGEAVRTGCDARQLSGQAVTLQDGSRLAATAVIDGRGARPEAAMRVAFQKFVGQVVELERDHELEGPILMDATVEQSDGFRFFYSLPFGARTLLVEDTRYSERPDLDREDLRREIRSYCEARGWRIREIVREEQGVLPIVLSGSIDELIREGGEVPLSGVRAGMFHHTTGYSFAEAVRLADDLAARASFEVEGLGRSLRTRSRAHWRQQRYFRLLNRMMFRAAEPARRYRVLEHFYRLPEALVERFYAGRLSWTDRIRILCGKPPVPVGRALRCVFES